MYPKIYLKTETDFAHNGLGFLRDIISCYVEEEHNSTFELEMTYKINGHLYEHLEKGNIIKANASDRLKDQLFRIYKTLKKNENTITVYAEHISYDLAHDTVKNINIKAQSCEYALNEIFRQSDFCTHFKGYSDIQHSASYKMTQKDCLSAIVGTSGSIIDTYGNGAEILRDNFNIHVLNRRGKDDNVLIAYKKNMTGIEIEEDTTDLITRIYPYVKQTDSETNEESIITPSFGYVDSSMVNYYEHPYSRFMDFTEKFDEGEEVTDEKFKTVCEKYFKDNKCDYPKTNYKIQFIALSKTENYKDKYKALEDVGLMDLVIIRDSRFNIDTEAKVIKAKYDVIKEKYENIELGDPRTKLNDIIIGNDGEDGKDGLNGADGLQGIPGVPGQDGKTYYTWIKYADNELGFNMSNYPDGKEYIGIAYNKETPIESNIASDYTWSKFKGDQGIPGRDGSDGTPGINGADGKTYYTWIKYADTETGIGMSDNPTGKLYIGISYNNLSNVESTNPKDYAWSLIKGEDGRPGVDGADGVTYYTWIKYADSATGAGMSDSPNGKEYIGIAYNMTTKEESSDASLYAWSLIKGEDGIPGINGQDGKTYYTWIKYSKYANGQSMQDSPEGMTYMGIAYNKDTAVESNNPADYAWSLIKGQDGTTYYTWIKYADDAQGNGMSDISTGKAYIGIAYNQLSQTESTNPADYTWTKIKGDQGIPGAPGANGQTLYTWVKYADDNVGTGMSDDPAGKAWLGLAFNKTVQQESNDYRDYTWSKIKGEDGQDGQDGQDGDMDKFPDYLPATPIATAQGFFNSIEIVWTYEAKVYLEYELYASQTVNFTPNTANLLFKGRASTFLHEVAPNQTWYYKVRAVNTHGRSTAFSAQVSASTFKLNSSNIGNYIENLAINHALIGSLDVSKVTTGKLKATYIDAKELTVTDGNGARTLYIDSYGRVYLNVSSLQVNSSNVETEDGVVKKIEAERLSINNKIEKEIGDVNTSIGNLNSYMEGAFKDGILSEAEKEALREHLKIVEREKNDITAQVTSLKVAPELVYTTELVDLNDKQSAFNTAYTNFINAINSIINTGTGNYDTQSTAYKTKTSELRTSMQTANAKIAQVKASKVESALQSEISTMQQNLSKEISDLNTSITNVKDTIIPSIEDGIIDDIEKAKIEASLSTLASEKADIDNQYNTIYANTDLVDTTTSTPKKNLYNAYANYCMDYKSLVDYINEILVADTITSFMKTNLQYRFDDHDFTLGIFAKAIQNALNAIANRKAEGAVNTAKSYTDAKVKIEADRITSTVTRVSSLEGKVSTAESSITQLSNQITSKVDVNGVKSVIEQNPNSVKIGFNGISDTIEMYSGGMKLKTSAGLLHTILQNGTVRFMKLDGTSLLGSFSRIKWENTTIEGLSCSMDEQTYFTTGFFNGSVYITKFLVSATEFTNASGSTIKKGVHSYDDMHLHNYSIQGVNTLYAGSVNITGTLSSNSGIFSGNISGVIGTFSSQVKSDHSFITPGWIQCDGNLRTTAGNIYANTGHIFATNGQVKSSTMYATSWISATNFVTHTSIETYNTLTKSVDSFVVETQATMSMTPNIEHIGSSKVENGECIVYLPLPLTRMGTVYVVSITPIGLGNIYVAEKCSDYFVVKGDNLEFDYVIKMKEAKTPSRLSLEVKPVEEDIDLSLEVELEHEPIILENDDFIEKTPDTLILSKDNFY